MNDQNRRLNIRLEIEKGDAAMRQATLLSESREYDGAISRAYYVLFHYAAAVLLTKGLEARSHEGLIRLFNLHFIKSEIFPKKFSTILSHSQKAREESDYRPEIPFGQEEAEVRMREAEDFLSRMKAYLRETSYLT